MRFHKKKGKELMMLTQVNIFDGASNRITFEQVYSKKFKCEYMLDLYPFDTQVVDFSINIHSLCSLTQVCSVQLVVRHLARLNSS